jgi:hypothetical protein
MRFQIDFVALIAHLRQKNVVNLQIDFLKKPLTSQDEK